MSDLVSLLGPRLAWQPADGKRHCYLDEQLIAWGTHVMALCGKGMAARRMPRDQWLWPTCPDCDDQAHHMQTEACSGTRRS